MSNLLTFPFLARIDFDEHFFMYGHAQSIVRMFLNIA